MNYFMRQEFLLEIHELAAQPIAVSLQETYRHWAMRLSVCAGFLRE
jgi:hypothetical protein